jgi:hypothetical protein
MQAPAFPLPAGHTFGPTCGDLSVHDGRQWQDSTEVQQVLGLPVTGRLGPDEWTAVRERELPGKPEPPPKPEPTANERYYAKLRKQREQERWAKFSKYKVVYNQPGAPAWYPGRPFGPNETGPHVERLRELLGLRAKGRYTKDMARRVSGLQRAHGLPERTV